MAKSVTQATDFVKKHGVSLSCVEGSDFITSDELQNLKQILQDGANQLYLQDGELFQVVFDNMTTVSSDWLDWKFGSDSSPSITIGKDLASKLLGVGFASSVLSKYLESAIDIQTLQPFQSTPDFTEEEECSMKTLFNDLYHLSGINQAADHIEIQTRQILIDEELTALCAIYAEEYHLAGTNHVTIFIRSLEAATNRALDCIRILFCPSVTNYPEEIPVVLVTKKNLTKGYDGDMSDFFTQAAISEIQAQHLIGTPFIFNIITWLETNANQLFKDYSQWHSSVQPETEEVFEPEKSPEKKEERPKLQAIDLSDQVYFSSYNRKPSSNTTNNNNNNKSLVLPPPEEKPKDKKKKKKAKKTTKFDQAVKDYEARSETFKPVVEIRSMDLRARFFPKIRELQNSHGEERTRKLQEFQSSVAQLTLADKDLIKDMLNEIQVNNEAKTREVVHALVFDGEKLREKDFEFGNRNLLREAESAFMYSWTLFSFNDTKLTKVPYIMGKLDTLQELNLYSNEIEYLPPELENLKNLRKLILTRNKLKSIDFAIEKLSSLTVLKLGFNQLKSIPEGVGALKNLQTLDLERNPLRTVPDSIAMLYKLNYLSLQNTKVSVIAPEVGLLPLEVLQLRNTPQKMIPPDVYHKGIEAVLDYLKSYSPEHSDIGGSKMASDIASLYNNKEFSDINFQVEGKLLFAHKIILNVRVPRLLQDLGSKEDLEVQTIHVDIKHDVFSAFLNHVYSDTIAIPFPDQRADFAAELLSLAQHHDLQMLAAACNYWLTYKQVGKKPLAASQFVKQIGTLYRRNETESQQDVTFSVEGVLIRADKIILSCRSEYFQSMFASGLREAQSEVVELTDVSAGVFQAIVEYLYTDDVEEITSEIAIDLLMTSCTYGIHRLSRIVENLIGYSLDIDNVTCILEVALLYKCEMLKRACVLFSMLNYRQVKTSEGYATMSPEGAEFLKSQAQKWRVSSTDGLNKDE